MIETKYKKLIEKLPLLPVKTEEGYNQAMQVINDLMARDNELTITEIGYFNVLFTLVQKYEDEQLKGKFGHVEGNYMLEYLLEQRELSQAKAAEIACVTPQKMNDFMKGRQGLAKEARIKLGEFFRLPQHMFEIEVKKAAKV